MRLLSAILSLLTAATIVPLAFSTPVSHHARGISLVRRNHGLVAKEHVPTTNAERFAQGLPPLSPSKSRNHGSPTRRDVVSPIPPTSYLGYIEIYHKITGALLGHIAAKGSDQGYYDYSTDDSDKLIVAFSLPAGQTSGSGLSLLAANSKKTIAVDAPYFGLAAQNSDLTSATGWAWITPTAQSTSTTATHGTNAANYAYIETAVWSVNIVTGAMSAGWTNSDSTILSLPFLGLNNDVFVGGAVYASSSYAHLTLKFVLIV